MISSIASLQAQTSMLTITTGAHPQHQVQTGKRFEVGSLYISRAWGVVVVLLVKLRGPGTFDGIILWTQDNDYSVGALFSGFYAGEDSPFQRLT